MTSSEFQKLTLAEKARFNHEAYVGLIHGKPLQYLRSDGKWEESATVTLLAPYRVKPDPMRAWYSEEDGMTLIETTAKRWMHLGKTVIELVQVGSV